MKWPQNTQENKTVESPERFELTRAIQILEEAANNMRHHATTINRSNVMSTDNAAAVAISLKAIATRCESYATYLEDCRIMLAEEEAGMQRW